MNTTLTLLFATYSSMFHLPPGLLSSLCFVESRHTVTAVHQDDGTSNSLGVCQVQLPAAQLVGFKGMEEDLMEPEINVYYAAKYLAHQIHRYKGSTYKGIIAYNRGSAKNLTRTAYADKVMKEWGKQ